MITESLLGYGKKNKTITEFVKVGSVSPENVIDNLVAIFSWPQQKQCQSNHNPSDCLVLLSADCLTSWFQSCANFSDTAGLF